MQKLKLQLYLPRSLVLNLTLLKVRLFCAHGREQLLGELSASSCASRAAECWLQRKAQPELVYHDAQQHKLASSKYLVGKARLLPIWVYLCTNYLGTVYTVQKWHKKVLAFHGALLLRNDMPVGPLLCLPPLSCDIACVGFTHKVAWKQVFFLPS